MSLFYYVKPIFYKTKPVFIFFLALSDFYHHIYYIYFSHNHDIYRQ